MHASVRPIPWEPIAPLVYNSLTVPGSEVRFSASCFEGKDWSLANMYEPQDAYRHPEFAARLANALSGLSAKDVYAPTPTRFNGEIVLNSYLNTVIHLPHGVFVHRNRNAFADGTFLRRQGEAGMFSAGGCGVVMAEYRGQLIFAHAGRESILDRQTVRTGGKEKGRLHDLAENILIAHGVQNFKEVHFWPLYFIRPEHFVHVPSNQNPEHAAYNRGAIEYLPREYPDDFGQIQNGALYLNLPFIFRAQCVKLGVLAENVHLEHCYIDDELPTTVNGGGRYLAVVVREF